ncbi:protein arsC [Thamnidium elegans]|nr:protein arsC [Thamnidium elegans]
MLTSDKVFGVSAGSVPADKVHPDIAEVMAAVGIDLSNELAEAVSIIVTMGCNVACPYVPDVQIIDWLIPDPKVSDANSILTIRDDIEERIKQFIKEQGF